MRRDEFLKTAAVAVPGLALPRVLPPAQDGEEEGARPLLVCPVETVDRLVLHDGRVVELQRLASPPGPEDYDRWRIQWSRLVEERTIDDHHLDALRYLRVPDWHPDKTRIAVSANRWGKTVALDGRLPLTDRERESVYETEVHEDFVHSRDVRFNDWQIITRLDHHRPYLQVQADGPCSETGEMHRWRGRKWFLSKHMTESEVVQTAFLAVMTAVEHETREAFTYAGHAIFSPHYDIHKLVALWDGSPVNVSIPPQNDWGTPERCR